MREDSHAVMHEGTDNDVSLVQLTNEMTRQLEDGSEFDLDAFIDMHPQHADELRRLYPTVKGMVALGRSSGGVAQEVTSGETVSGVLGDYRIIREVGRGGMGVVYEAEQISLSRRVALKILPLAAVLDPRQLQRFKTEAQAAALLDHQNIVSIYAVGSERSVHYYAMQFIEGQTLANVIGDLQRIRAVGDYRDDRSSHDEEASQVDGSQSRIEAIRKSLQASDSASSSHTASQTKRDLQAAISTQRSTKSAAYFRIVAEFGIQVAEALQHAHQLGVIHRDIKPSNLILDALGKVWVTDFGLARIERDAGLTMTGDVIGTLRYMSPEQALAKRVSVDQRTDIYSLGVTLYELLTLRPAYDGKDRQELLRQISFEEPPAPRKLNRAMPSEMATIVLKAMAKNPHERYDTAADLADDLQRFLDDRPIIARRPTFLQRGSKYLRRHKAIVSSLIAAAVLMLVTVAIASVVIAGQERSNRLAVEQAKRQVERNAARLARNLAEEYLEDAQRWCGQGQIATGMLWMARSLQIVPEEDRELHRSLRASLSAWSPRLHKLKVVLEHEADVTAVAYSPDGTTILTGDADGKLRLWRAGDGKSLGQFAEQPGPVSALAFNPDGSQILTGTTSGVSQLWDVATLKPIGKPMEHDGQVRSVMHQGQVIRALIQVDDKTLQIKDAVATSQIGQLLNHRGRVADAVFSPDGSQILSGSDDMAISLWDASTGQLLGDPLVAPNVKPSKITAVAFSPDGSRIAAASEASWVWFWKADTRESIGYVWIAGVAHKIAMTSDGSQLLSGLGKAILQDATEPDRPLGQPLVHRDRVLTVAFAADGFHVVTGSKDHSARVWDLAENSKPIKTFPREGNQFSRAVALSPDGSRILRAVGPAAEVLDIASAQRVGQTLRHDATIRSIAYSHDGKRILSGDGRGLVRIWNAESHELIGELVGHSDQVCDVSTSPDGKRILTASFDMTARLWDAITLKPIEQLLQHKGGVYKARFSPDGRRIITTPWDNPAILWDVASGSVIAELGNEAVSVAFSPDGKRIATGGRQNRANVWDGRTGLPVGKPIWHEDGGAISDVVFSPNGQYILSANDKAQLWDAATGVPLGPPIESEKEIRQVAFSPDGSYVLTHGPEADTSLWQLPSARIDGGPERILLWAQVVTGMELNLDTGEAHAIDGHAWHQRVRRLQQLGGAPFE